MVQSWSLATPMTQDLASTTQILRLRGQTPQEPKSAHRREPIWGLPRDNLNGQVQVNSILRTPWPEGAQDTHSVQGNERRLAEVEARRTSQVPATTNHNRRLASKGVRSWEASFAPTDPWRRATIRAQASTTVITIRHLVVQASR
jgi:hypothetical protein